jgi:poly-gamma-glutamate capsule biosynthesis protein CapA/YwtB (metallophosphatase superfamily)
MLPQVVLATGDLAMDPAHSDESYVVARGLRWSRARHAVLARPDGAAALGRAGFDVISLAGNLYIDWGSDALLETRAPPRPVGIAVDGAGVNIADARAPLIEQLGDGTRLAISADPSFLPMATWADEPRAGCAPMRAVLGGHPLILTGCEAIGGKPVCYPPCNFAIDRFSLAPRRSTRRRLPPGDRSNIAIENS